MSAQPLSVQPEWCRILTLQQQSVLLLAARGPDGIEKHHPCKVVHVAYRACVQNAAKYGRALVWGEKADTFMSLDVFADDELWNKAVDAFFRSWDSLPAHYVKHFMHGVEILGYKHPLEHFRKRWHDLYVRFTEEFHVNVETEAQMDTRLGDWSREHWNVRLPACADYIHPRERGARSYICGKPASLYEAGLGNICQDCANNRTVTGRLVGP